MRDDPVDQPDFKRARGIQNVSGECHFRGHPATDKTRQEIGAPITRIKSQFDVSLTQLCAFRRDPDVASQTEVKTASRRSAIDRGDDRKSARNQLLRDGP
jgi:hypothetical protein